MERETAKMTDDIFEVSDPGKGWNTLVADVAILQVERIASKLKELRSQGVSPEELRRYLATHFEDIDPNSQEKIFDLAMGNIPPDDFSREQIENSAEESERTLQFTLKEDNDQFVPGTLVFFEGKRWVITATRKREFILKKV